MKRKNEKVGVGLLLEESINCAISGVTKRCRTKMICIKLQIKMSISYMYICMDNISACTTTSITLALEIRNNDLSREKTIKAFAASRMNVSEVFSLAIGTVFSRE